VFAVADHIHVLYLGQMVASLDAKQTNRDEVVGYITGTRIRDQLVEETAL
jgi:D-xylose transport system ATP-binding protein